MENREISGSVTLALQITLLKAERMGCEEALDRSFNELTQLIFNPVLTLKEVRFEQQDRKRDLLNLTKMVLNMGTDYLIEQSFGKRQKFREFLTSIMVELASTPLISKNITKIVAKISNQFIGEKEND